MTIIIEADITQPIPIGVTALDTIAITPQDLTVEITMVVAVTTDLVILNILLDIILITDISFNSNQKHPSSQSLSQHM